MWGSIEKLLPQFSDELGYRFNIYQYSEYTGQDEFIMFYLKQKEDGDWYIHKRIPDA